MAVRTVRELYTGSPDMMSVPAIWPDEWWVAVKVPFEDGYVYELYQVNSFDEKVLTKTRIESPFVNFRGPNEPPIDSPEKAVEYSKNDEKVTSFLEKTLLPAVEVTYTDGTWHVFWYDMFSRMNEGRVHSGVTAIVSEDGTLTTEFSMRYPFGRDSAYHVRLYSIDFASVYEKNNLRFQESLYRSMVHQTEKFISNSSISHKTIVSSKSKRCENEKSHSCIFSDCSTHYSWGCVCLLTIA